LRNLIALIKAKAKAKTQLQKKLYQKLGNGIEIERSNPKSLIITPNGIARNASGATTWLARSGFELEEAPSVNRDNRCAQVKQSQPLFIVR
jgi:hypothetical protein